MFSVRWEETALNELADVWVRADAPLRQAITQATTEIDRQLARDPYAESESRDADRRVLFVAPLGVTFRVEEDARTVSVLHVWTFTMRP
jgi:hypothetical protein